MQETSQCLPLTHVCSYSPLQLGLRVLQESAAMLACLSKRKRGAQRALHRGRINLGARDRCLWNAPQHAAHEMSTRIRAAHMTMHPVLTRKLFFTEEKRPFYAPFLFQKKKLASFFYLSYFLALEVKAASRAPARHRLHCRRPRRPRFAADSRSQQKKVLLQV